MHVISTLRDRCDDPLGVLERAFDRVLPRLGLKKSPISITSRYVRVSGVAGVLRLTPRIHLEIVPKIYHASDPWREDLFFMTTLSRYGRLLSNNSLSVATGSITYPSMMAEALADEIRSASSRPLRLYMASQFTGFELVGEADPIDMVAPMPEGIPQDTSSLTDKNAFSGTIAHAARRALRHAATQKNARLLADYARRYEHIPMGNERRVPRHAENWHAAYEIALSILGRGSRGRASSGTGLSDMMTRGDRVWEDLIWAGLRSVPGAIKKPANLILGISERVRHDATDMSEISVNPDYLLKSEIDPASASHVVDAKYKALKSAPSNADVYEMLAFCRAASSDKAILLYPCRESVGYLNLCSRIKSGGVSIMCFQLGVRGVSQKSGLIEFIHAVRRVTNIQ